MALFVPVVMNCTFSCELFLKSLLPKGTRGHALFNQLFTNLDSNIANNIQNAVVHIMKEKNNDYSKADFENDLIEHEKAFEEWRYFHEKHNTSTFDLDFMSVFQACVKAIAEVENRQNGRNE